ncbi:hypothetical protein CAEBREN_29901 [Caenorhabditis brenneri]|uniref:Reticulon domain-containing protein n=1 Tax=Caenorhabditis brenneri TaxID=135651 RepID=G0P9U0_CAEBE|nr:hypothetical protein CAEBREN_29901 [Caenorhabditis brenneri]
MTSVARGLAIVALVAFIIQDLWPYRLQILLLAEMFIIAREVYRITRTSGVLKYKKENGNQTIRLIIFLHALKDIVHAFVEFPLIMMVAFFGASIIPKIYKDNQKTIDPLLARYSENIEKFKKWHDSRFPPRIPVDAEEKKDE